MTISLYLALGSNVGDRRAYLRQACAALAQAFAWEAASPVYESAALLPEGAEEEWNQPFLNMVVAVRVSDALEPHAVLHVTQELERRLGRIRRGHWGPREIDIDLLALGEVVLTSPDLTIPHPEMTQRDFVMLPLADIAPYWRHPLLGKSAAELAASLPASPSATIRKLGALHEED